MAGEIEARLKALDLVLPGLKGRDLVKKILEESPKTRVILMSGRREALESIEKNLEEGVYAYLRKPFEVQDVLNILDLGEEEPG